MNTEQIHFEVRQKIFDLRVLLRRQLPLGELKQCFFIVGAQKAGTTALHSYLAAHPMIFSERKEPAFFHRDRLYSKGTDYYRAMFPVRPAGTHAMDATPEYLYYRTSAERIHRFRQDARIIALLREPVGRAFSAFNMYRQSVGRPRLKHRLRLANAEVKAFYAPLTEGKVSPDLHYFLDREMEIIRQGGDTEEPGLIRRGIYAPQLGRFVRLFGRDKVLVLFSDDLRQRPEETVNRVLAFLGLEPLVGAEYPLRHVRKYTVDDSGKDVIRQYAGALFAKDKEELRNRFGLEVPW